MNKLIIMFFGLSVVACTTMKNDLVNDENNLYDDLVGLVVKESFKQGEECLNIESISFEFKFPEFFNGGITILTINEKGLIEEGLKSSPIDWNDILKTRYKSKNSSNCLHISKPIFFRNDKFAFIYKAQNGAEFYNIYEKLESGWQFKENIISTLN
ncbi:MAG: hypothetical protein WBP08_03225 [Saprospiraceae bacterium]